MALTVALLAAASAGDAAPASNDVRLGARPSASSAVDLRLREPWQADARPLEPGRRPSVLGAAAGFFLGDALVVGAVAGARLLVSETLGGRSAPGPEMALAGAGVVAAYVVPPLLGTYGGGGGRGAPGSQRAFIVSSVLHAAGLFGAILLAERGEPWLAGGLVAAVDLGAAPWVVARTLATTPALVEDDVVATRALPERDPAALGTRR